MSNIRLSAMVKLSSGCRIRSTMRAEDKLIAILQEARAQALTTHKIVPIPHPASGGA
jgi:hypothetical protein